MNVALAPTPPGDPRDPRDPADRSPLLVQLRAAEGGRPPFIPARRFIPTGFSHRLMSVLGHAMTTGAWYLVTALSGDGKSKSLAQFRSEHPAFIVEEPGGRRVRKVPVLTTRVSSGIQSADKLMHALAHGLGAVPSLREAERRQWLVEALRTAEVRLIVIDDAHELTMHQLSYLRELTGQLAELGWEPAVVLLAACDSTDPRSGQPWKMIVRSDLVAEQFNRRLDGPDPIVFIEGLSRVEVGRVLSTWDLLYRDRFPDLHLATWTTSAFGWLTDPRNDKARTGLVRMRHLTATVNAALAVAWAEERTGLRSDGMDLYGAALRITVRGYTIAVVPADHGDAVEGEP
jgi:hypothetical protein